MADTAAQAPSAWSYLAAVTVLGPITAVLGAKRSLVTVDRIVEALEPRPGGVVIPGWAIDAVAEAPGGSLPSYSLGITVRDKLKPSTSASATQCCNASAIWDGEPTMGVCRLPRMKRSINIRFVQPTPSDAAIDSMFD